MMPRLSKTVCRKRLNEAVTKILVVWNGRNDNMTRGDMNKLLKAVDLIDDVAKKFK